MDVIKLDMAIFCTKCVAAAGAVFLLAELAAWPLLSILARWSAWL